MNADEKILFTQTEIQTHSLLLHSWYLLGKLNQKVEGQEKVFRFAVCVGVCQRDWFTYGLIMRPCARQAGTNIALQMTTHNHRVKPSGLLLHEALCARVWISLTAHPAACSSFVAPCSVCTSTGPQSRAAQSGWRWGPSAAPRQTATAPRTSGLDARERMRCMLRHRRNTTTPPVLPVGLTAALCTVSSLTF